MLIKQSMIYGVGRVLPAAIYFCLIAFYTRILEPEAYGLYIFVYATVWFVIGILFQWIVSAAMRLSEGGTEAPAIRWGLCVSSVLAGGLAIVLALPVYVLIDRPDYRALVLAGLAMLLVVGWFEVMTAILSAELKATQYAIYNLARAVASACFGGLLAWMGYGALGIVLGTTLGVMIPASVLTIHQWRGFTLRPARFSELRRVADYGLPLMLSYTAANLNSTADRYILAGLKGASTLGHYSVGFELADRIMRALVTPIGAAALPLALRSLRTGGRDGAEDQLRRNLLLVAAVSLPAALGLIAVTPQLVEVMVGPAFRETSRAILPVMALALLLWALRADYFDHAFQLGLKTRRIVVVFLAAALTNIALCVPFVLWWGALGAAYANLCAQGVALVMSIHLGQRAFRMPIAGLELGKILAASLLMMGAVMTVPSATPLATLVLKVALGGAIYACALVAFNLMGVREQLLARAGLRSSAGR